MSRALATLTLCGLLCFAINGQQRVDVCRSDRDVPQIAAWRWPRDVRVRVFVEAKMFDDRQAEAIRSSLSDWNEIGHRTGSNIKFDFEGEVAGIEDCDSCLTISRGDLRRTDRKHAAYFYPIRRTLSGELKSAWICIDLGTTNIDALHSLMSHEMSHGMGLPDCPSCKRGESIMASFPGVNKPNGLLLPSACDIAAMKRLFERGSAVAMKRD